MIVLLLLEIALACHVTNKGVTQSLSHTITHSMNQLRNQIATGQIQFQGSKTASNMNLVNWSNGLAKRAQMCAEKCPTHAHQCSNHNEFGVLTTVIHLKSHKSSSKVMDYWIQEDVKAKQILLARETHVGCGKAQDDRQEYIVCYFDKKATDQAPFLAGPIGSACKLGMSKMYSGLCATSSMNLLQKNTELPTETFLMENDFM